MRILLLTGFVFFSCLSCQTIHYTNNSQVPLEYEHSKWHHIALAGLLELSEPVNPSQVCSKKNWKAVRTQMGFLNGLASSLVQLPLYYLSNTTIPFTIYSPQTVSISCRRQEQF